VLVGPGELRKMQDQRPFGAGLRGEVRRNRGVADALSGAGGISGEDLGFEQCFEELLVGSALVARAAGGLLETLKQPGSLHLGDQERQPVTDPGDLDLAHAKSSA
jgi:hypothetical protein